VDDRTLAHRAPDVAAPVRPPPPAAPSWAGGVACAAAGALAFASAACAAASVPPLRAGVFLGWTVGATILLIWLGWAASARSALVASGASAPLRARLLCAALTLATPALVGAAALAEDAAWPQRLRFRAARGAFDAALTLDVDAFPRRVGGYDVLAVERDGACVRFRLAGVWPPDRRPYVIDVVHAPDGALEPRRDPTGVRRAFPLDGAWWYLASPR